LAVDGLSQAGVDQHPAVVPDAAVAHLHAAAFDEEGARVATSDQAGGDRQAIAARLASVRRPHDRHHHEPPRDRQSALLLMFYATCLRVVEVWDFADRDAYIAFEVRGAPLEEVSQRAEALAVGSL